MSKISGKHRLLYSTRESSDATVKQCLDEHARARGMVRGSRKEVGWTPSSAFNDSELGGGGYDEVYKSVVRSRAFCPNTKSSHGEMVCGRMLPEGHTNGACPNCGAQVLAELPGGFKSFLNVDYYFCLEAIYKLLFAHTDIAQCVVDYYPTSISRLSAPLTDEHHKVKDTQSGLVARYDFSQNPHRFKLDIVPKIGEHVMYNLGPGSKNGRVDAQVEAELESSFVIRRAGSSVSETVPKETVEKIRGTIQLNVVTAEDAAEVYDNPQYSNMGKTEFIVNVHAKHQRREELCAVLGISAGGSKQHNALPRNIFYELQRRRLQEKGCIVGLFTVWFDGRQTTVHSATSFRNEFCRVMDNPEVETSAGVMGQRNIHSLSPFLDNFEARSVGYRAVYSFLLNQNAEPRSRQSMAEGFSKAEAARGTAEWDQISRATGYKFKTLAWAGCEEPQIAADESQDTYMRVEHEKFHSQGIVANLFREFLISLIPKQRRAVLAGQKKLIRQPKGEGAVQTKPHSPAAGPLTLIVLTVL